MSQPNQNSQGVKKEDNLKSQQLNSSITMSLKEAPVQKNLLKQLDTTLEYENSSTQMTQKSERQIQTRQMKGSKNYINNSIPDSQVENQYFLQDVQKKNAKIKNNLNEINSVDPTRSNSETKLQGTLIVKKSDSLEILNLIDKEVQVNVSIKVHTKENYTQTDFQESIQQEPKYDFLNAVLKSKLTKLEVQLNEEIKGRNQLKEGKALLLSQLELSEVKIVSQASLIDKLQKQETEYLEKIKVLMQVSKTEINESKSIPKSKDNTEYQNLKDQIDYLQDQLKKNKNLMESQQEEIFKLDRLNQELIAFKNEQLKKNDQDIQNIREEKDKILEQRHKENIQLKQQLKILKQKYDSRPPRQQDIQKIKQLTKDFEQLSVMISQKEKLLNQSSDIIQFFQMEIENYKKNYNLFNQQETEQGGEISTQIQPQITLSLVGLDEKRSYQKSLLRKQFKQKSSHSVDTQQDNIKVRPNKLPQNEKNQTLPYIEVSSRSKNAVSLDNSDISSLKKYSISNSINYSESNERKSHQVQTIISKTKQFNTNLEKRKRITLQFQNPLENDKLLFHAQKLVESLYNEEPNLSLN